MRSPRERVSTKKDERLKYFHVGERKRINKGGQGKAFTVLWLECWPAHRMIMGFIHHQGHISGMGFSPRSQLGFIWEATSPSLSVIDVSLSLCPFPLSLQSKGKNILMWGLTKKEEEEENEEKEEKEEKEEQQYTLRKKISEDMTSQMPRGSMSRTLAIYVECC